MPRIRTLKPEHKSHRRIGRLTDRQYRLWVGMITEADDQGRFVADAEQLKAVIFPYQGALTIEEVTQTRDELHKLRAIRLYRVSGTTYGVIPGWDVHQRIDKPKPSLLPPPTVHDTSSTRRGHVVDSSSNDLRRVLPDRKGSEGIKERIGWERKGGESEGRETQPPPARALGGASAAGSNHNPETAHVRVRREEAPAEWFHDCGDGRQRKCVKSEYLDRVDLGIQCYAHERARKAVEAKPLGA